MADKRSLLWGGGPLVSVQTSGRKVGLVAALALVGLALPALAGAATTNDRSLALKVAYDHSSIYLFRGLDVLAGQPVDPGNVRVGWEGLKVYWWGYAGELPAATAAAAGLAANRYLEHDFGVEYAWEKARTTWTVGAVTYTYQHPAELADTVELYAIAGFGGFLSPTLSLYYDVDVYDGGYASLGVSHAWELGHGLALTPSASYGHSLGWTGRTFLAANDWNPNDFLLGLDVRWARGPFALHATAQRSFALRALEDVGHGDVTAYTLGGSYSF